MTALDIAISQATLVTVLLVLGIAALIVVLFLVATGRWRGPRP